MKANCVLVTWIVSLFKIYMQGLLYFVFLMNYCGIVPKCSIQLEYTWIGSIYCPLHEVCFQVDFIFNQIEN